MFAKEIADCFPIEDLPRMYECTFTQCFYYTVLMKHDEVVWKHYWNELVEDLDLVARCPSCNSLMMEYEQDGIQKTVV